jgi:hypothetical protein
MQKNNDEPIVVPQSPLDRPETLKEAIVRREAEARRDKRLMEEALRLAKEKINESSK